MSPNDRLPPRRLGLLVALALAGLAPLARAGEMDPCLPADSILVIKINVRQLLDSRLAQDYWAAGLRWQYEKYFDAIPKNGPFDKQDFFVKDVGFDPFKDLDRVILTASGADAPRKDLTILRGRFDPAKLHAKVEELMKSQADAVQVLRAPDGKGGDFRIYQVYPGSADPTFVALPDATSLFLAEDKEVLVEALKKVGAPGKAELKDKDLQAVLEDLDDQQVISVAAVGDVLERVLELVTLPSTHALFRDSVQRVAAFSGGLTLGDDVKCNVTVRVKTAEEAAALYTTADTSVRLALAAMALKRDEDNPLDELLFDIIRSIKVHRKDRTLLFSGRINVEEAEADLQKAGVDIEHLKEAFKKPFEK